MSDKPSRYFESGKAYYDDKNYNEAIKQFSSAARLAPQNARYWEWLALAYTRRAEQHEEDYSRVLDAANRAIEVNATRVLAYELRGYAYRMGHQDYDRALSDYEPPGIIMNCKQARHLRSIVT